jgi:hypothetical protein
MSTFSSVPVEVKCSWDECPSHMTLTPARALTLHWPRAIDKVRYFHSTECLAGWALSFPKGMLITGEESVGTWDD